MGSKTADYLQYAYRKRPLHEIYPDLADVPEEFILEWFKDRYDYPRFHSHEELKDMMGLPPEAVLQWLEEAVAFVWAVKHKEWNDRQSGHQLFSK
jgi:hypothetical protein